MLNTTNKGLSEKQVRKNLGLNLIKPRPNPAPYTYESIKKWLDEEKINLNEDQLTVFLEIIVAIEMNDMIKTMSGKTFLFKIIDRYLDSQPKLG